MKFMREDCQRGASAEEALHVWTRDWRLLSCQIPRLMEEFAKSPPENVLSILLPRLVDGEGAEALLEPLSTPQQSVLLRKLGRYGSVFFGARNGKYELDLSDPLHRECARRLASRSSAERRWCLSNLPEELPAPPEGAPFILDQPPITKPTDAQRATFFGEGSEQRYGSGCLRNVSYGNIQLTGVLGDDFLGAIIEARAPRGTLRFDYSSLMPVAEGEALPHAAFRRTLNECGLPLDAVVLAGKIGRSYLESVEEDTGDAKWRARAKVIDERFLHDIDGGAHDPENPMAFLEPASPLDVGTAVAPVAAALRKEREDATGVIAGPAAAVLRAVQRAGTFTAEDLGESGDPEAPATPETRLREVLAKAYVDVVAWDLSLIHI